MSQQVVSCSWTVQWSRKEYYDKALIITKEIFGEEHCDVATSYNKLGNVYEALGQYNEAKECQEKALIMRKNIFGEEHGDIALSYTELFIKLLDSTMKQNNMTERHWSSAKSYSERMIVISQQVIRTWEMFIMLLAVQWTKTILPQGTDHQEKSSRRGA